MIVGNAIKLADVSDPIFGDASLGNVHITVDTNLSSMFPDFAEDTGVFELNCKDFTLDSGKTLTADKRNAGVIIRVKGNCTINGSILNNLAPRTLLAEAQAIVESKYPSWLVENGSGGDGKAGGNSYQNTGGNGQLGRFYGGGASGGGAGGSGWVYYSGVYSNPCAGGHGGDATNITTENTAFVGGQHGIPWGQSLEVGQAGAFGGGAGGGAGRSNAGDTPRTWNGADGASGAGSNGNAGVRNESGSGGACGNWGGGVVIIICSGNLIIDGTINCNGNKGGNGDNYNYGNYRSASGGGAGGGRIYLLAKKSITTTGATFSVLGGAKGTGGYADGTDGEDGDKYYTTYKNYKDGIAPIPLSA